jgi:hypothetical protein
MLHLTTTTTNNNNNNKKNNNKKKHQRVKKEGRRKGGKIFQSVSVHCGQARRSRAQKAKSERGSAPGCQTHPVEHHDLATPGVGLYPKSVS